MITHTLLRLHYLSGVKSVITCGHTKHALPPHCLYQRHCDLMEQVGSSTDSLSGTKVRITSSTTPHIPSFHCIQECSCTHSRIEISFQGCVPVWQYGQVTHLPRSCHSQTRYVRSPRQFEVE